MPDVLAVVSKAVFDKVARELDLDLGRVWPTDTYASTGKGLMPLAEGGRLFLATVRPPDEALWLVAVIDAPKLRKTGWTGTANATPIRDVSALKSQIRFATGAGMPTKKGVLGMSLQTPRVLTAADAALLSDGAIQVAATKPAKPARSPRSANAKPAKVPRPVKGPEPAPTLDAHAVLARWKQTRSPRLADLLCCVPVDLLWPDRLHDIARLRADLASRRIKDLPDDPRTTVFLIDLLRKAKWPGSGATTTWNNVFAKLVTLRDTRAIAPLRAMVESPPYFLGARFTRWCVEQIGATADALAALELGADDAETTRLAAAQTVDPPRRGWFAATGPNADAEALLAQVWAAPDDLPLRSVIGDALIELGDPWGEFIALQARGAKRDSKPVKDLLRKHGARFGGPLVHVGAREYMTFEHGFLASCHIGREMVGRRRWEDVVSAPHWATVRRVSFDGRAPPKWWFREWLAHSNLVSLREIAIYKLSLTRASARDPWVMTKVPRRLEWSLGQVLEGLLEGLPAEELRRIPAPTLPKAYRTLQDALAKVGP